MGTETLQADIIEQLNEYKKETRLSEIIYENKEETKGRNEFLFFIKPEITSFSENVHIDEIINLIFSKIKAI